VLCDAQTLRWHADGRYVLDADCFRGAVKRAVSAEQLQAAVALYTGDLLPECYDDWIAPERERLAEIHRNARQQLVDVLAKQGAYAAAVKYALSLACDDPLREHLWRQIMELHALNGDRAGVVKAYRTCRAVLKRELDVEPSAETEAAYAQWKQFAGLAMATALPSAELAVGPTQGRTLPSARVSVFARESGSDSVLSARMAADGTAAGQVLRAAPYATVGATLREAASSPLWAWLLLLIVGMVVSSFPRKVPEA
jgi:DNA-binding SARP family transcriptional activator